MSIWRVLSVLFPVLVCALGTMSVSGQELPPREGEEALLMVPPGAGGAPPDPADAAAFAGAADAYGANDFAAARAGVTAAQNRLAIMLAKGQGAKRDPETALMWFHVAAGLGAANAARNRDALARTLSQATRARAKRRADAFRPAVTKP